MRAFAVSRWGADPYARGSWSLIGRTGTPADRVTLGEPVGDRLRLVGEATHPTRAGMTHGAYEQGLAAASWAAHHARVAVVGSYRRLIDHLASGVDVRLRRPVTMVRRADDGVVLVSAAGDELRADATIVTVPVGALGALWAGSDAEVAARAARLVAAAVHA